MKRPKNLLRKIRIVKQFYNIELASNKYPDMPFYTAWAKPEYMESDDLESLSCGSLNQLISLCVVQISYGYKNGIQLK